MKHIFNCSSSLWEKHKVGILAILLFSLSVWLFSPSLNCNFLFFDENDEIFAEPHVNEGLSLGNIVWAFTSLGHSNWYPLNWLSHMLDCELFGLDPWGHHLTSILIHALNCVLVFLVLRMMTGALWRSFVVALVFGLHPLRVESVTWICERKDVLSLSFWLLTLMAYTRFAQESKEAKAGALKFYGLALLMFALGLMSKAMLVTMPFVILLLDYWPLERWRHVKMPQLIVEKVPFLVLSALVSWLTVKAQHLTGNFEEMRNLPMIDRIGNALISYVRYLGKFFWPENLSIYYPHPGHWPFWAVIGAGVFVVAISVIVFNSRRRQPYLLVGWFWFLGTLVPVIGLVQLLSLSMANRYTYISMIGVVICLVFGLKELTERWRYRTVILLAVGVPVMIVCVIRTRAEIGYFKDDVTIWQRTLAVTERESNSLAHYNFGVVLWSRSEGQMDAIKEFKEAVRLKPDYFEAQNFLAESLARQNYFDEALIHYQVALKLKPRSGAAWFNCGLIYLQNGKASEAIKCFQKSEECGHESTPVQKDYIAFMLRENGHTNQEVPASLP